MNGVPQEVVTWTDGNEDERDDGPTMFTIETTAESPVGVQFYRIPKDEEEINASDDARRKVHEYRNGAVGTVILRDDKLFAVVQFKWKEKGLDEKMAGGEPAAEELYLFEKLTGLPWKAYGKEVNFVKLETAKEWQSLFDVKVTGTKEGINLLSKSAGKPS